MEMIILFADFIPLVVEKADVILQLVSSILYGIAFLVTAIAFLKWIYRANKNCHGFGAQGMKFTPGWSIGYYFIPILSLYKPYQAMKEIWKVSTNPANWQYEKGSALLRWWWALWLISDFLWYYLSGMSMRVKTINYLQIYTAISILSRVFEISLDIVAISLITTIHNKQEKLVKKSL